MKYNAFSIIIPTYNAEDYIKLAVYSLLNQNYPRIEIIIIDDCSTDQTYNILYDEFNNVPDIILLKNKSNMGVSATRNIGIKESRFNYIIFLDSDDKYLEKSLFVLNDSLNNYNADLYLFSFKSNKHIKNRYENYGLIMNESTIQKTVHKQYCNAPWGKIFIKNIIERYNISFNEKLSMGEDYLFLYQYSKYCNKIFISNSQVYYYNVNIYGATYIKKIEYIYNYMYIYNILIKDDTFKKYFNKFYVEKTIPIIFNIIGDRINNGDIDNASFVLSDLKQTLLLESFKDLSLKIKVLILLLKKQKINLIRIAFFVNIMVKKWKKILLRKN